MQINRTCVFVLLVACYACNPGKSIFISKKKVIKRSYTAYEDSLNRAWKDMIAADDRKLSNIKRLLDEVSYTPSFDKEVLKALRIKLGNLTEKRYKQESMTGKQIDRYDAATDSIIHETLSLVQNTSEMQNHPITESLINDIEQEDQKVILYRVYYDDIAKNYNSFLEKNRDRISKLPPPYSAQKKIPLFELDH